MSWSAVAPGRFQRTIGENETFIKLVGDPGHLLNREHWAINAVASFTPRGSLAQQDLPVLFARVWKILRFHHPSIAAYATDDKTLEYTVPDGAALDQWTAETFDVVTEKTADDLIHDFKPSPYAMLILLPQSNQILFHTAHWRTDGVGILLLIDAFLDLAVSPMLPDPDSLAWGQEVPRLAPAVESAAGMPTMPTDAIKSIAQGYAETFYQASDAIGIPYKGNASTIPSGTRSTHLTFDATETLGIVDQCRMRGFSVSSALHASVAAANRALALKDNKQKHYTSTIRFSLRPYLPKPYSTPAYASGLYTTGWMKTIPASASWVDHAKAYNEEYRKGLNDEYINSHRQYALALGELIRNMPQGGDPPSDVDISSIGIAEKLIARFKGSSDMGLEVQSVSVGVEILTRQCVCLVWTFRNQLNLNLVYNASFHDEGDTTEFLHSVKRILLHELAMQD
ncbi:MAG: hypothetical protein Q9191_005466 [Dirinaria sp. TL-2023a]